jgi:hypothetical protein
MAQVYHIRTINGSPAPIPKSLEYTEMTLDMDSYRAASGLLIRNVLPTKKHKFNLVFKPMNKTELQALLTQLNADSFTVTYENMLTGAVDTGTFYANDRSFKPIWVKNEANTDVIFDVFSVNLIEY